MSIALGNKKPQQLLEVEKIIWRALFTLSEGSTAIEDILGGLLLQIPWERLQPLFLPAFQQDSEWFSIQTTAVSAAPKENNPQAPSLTGSLLPYNNTMVQSLDYQSQPHTAIPQTLEPENSAPGDSSSRQPSTPTASHLPNDIAMDETIVPVNSAPGDSSSSQPSTRTASHLPDDIAMDQTMVPVNSAPGDSSSSQPSTPTASHLPDDIAMDETIVPVNSAPGDSSPRQPSTPTASHHSDDIAMDETMVPVNSEPGDSSPRQPSTPTPSHLPDDIAMDDASEDIEQSLDALTSRRSVRLALGKSKEESLQSNRHQSTSAVKRKAPTGEAGNKKSLSSGGSRASPIDVDSLQAVFERYPVKLEPQVYMKIPQSRQH
jgi:hypothetical protein